MDTRASNGISFAGLLFILFLALKLTHVIAWSWVWVTAPLWMPLVATLAVLVAIIGFAWIASKL